MRYLFASIALLATVVLADQTAIVVTKNISMQIDMASGVTNSTYTYTFSIPQSVGQLQDSVNYTSDVPSATVSNDVAGRAVVLLIMAGGNTNNLSVVLPQ